MTDIVQKTTVLIVDDDDLVTLCLQDQLEDTFDVITASGGAPALDILESRDVDVIVSDQVMPGMSGDEFLQIAAQRWPDIPRVMLTGYADLGSVVRAVNYGRITQYISKPWDLQEMLRVLQSAVSLRKAKRASQTLAQERDCALEALEQGRQFLTEVVELQSPAQRGKDGGPMLLRSGAGGSLPLIIECVED